MNRAKLNYLVDVMIAISFLFSAISGLVFLPGSVNWGPNPGILGISYRIWNQVHMWGSLGMITGVFLHLALHWKWLFLMTKRMVPRINRRQTTVAIPEAISKYVASRGMNRRTFLRFGGMAVAGLVLSAVGYKATEVIGYANGDQQGLSGSILPATMVPLSKQLIENTEDRTLPTVAAAPTATATVSPQLAKVSCPFGIVNDPYPGRCRFYKDSNGNRICDHSELGL